MMKKITVLLLVALALFACKKEETKKRPDRMFINGTTYIGRSSEEDNKRIKDVVKNLWYLRAKGRPDLGISGGFTFSFNYNPIGSPYYQRDTINPKFLFWDSFVISLDGKSPGDFLMNARDIVYIIHKDGAGNIASEWSDTDDAFHSGKRETSFDTVAYTPNSVMQKAKAGIIEALASEDYDRCYQIFEREIMFIPTTGEEYRELEAKGLN